MRITGLGPLLPQRDRKLAVPDRGVDAPERSGEATCEASGFAAHHCK